MRNVARVISFQGEQALGSTSPKLAVKTVAPGLSADKRPASASASPLPTRSVLVSSRRSATATCFRDSGCRASVARPLTASTVATTPAIASRCARPLSVISACRMGAGSASPLVSITTRSNGVTSPASRRRRISSSVSTRSPRTAQHRHPVWSVTKLSSLVSTRSWSRPTSPNSLMITAVRANCVCRSSRPSSVVLPLPRKPVRTRRGSCVIPAPRARDRALSG